MPNDIDYSLKDWADSISRTPRATKLNNTPTKIEQLPQPSFLNEITIIPNDNPEIPQMTIGELMTIPASIFQRDPDASRLRKIDAYHRSKNLASSSVTIVHLVKRSDLNETFIADGNTRCEYYYQILKLFASGKLKKGTVLPEKVSYITHTAANAEEEHKIYNSFDNVGAVEKPKDKLGAAFLECEMGVTHPALTKHNFWTVMARFSPITKAEIATELDVYKKVVTYYEEQIRYIDKHLKWNVSESKRMTGETVVHLMAMLHHNWDDVDECESIIEYFNNVGCRINRKNKGNASCMVTHMVYEYRAKKTGHPEPVRIYGHKASTRHEVLGLWIEYYGKWRNDKYYVNLPNTTTDKQRRELATTIL